MFSCLIQAFPTSYCSLSHAEVCVCVTEKERERMCVCVFVCFLSFPICTWTLANFCDSIYWLLPVFWDCCCPYVIESLPDPAHHFPRVHFCQDSSWRMQIPPKAVKQNLGTHRDLFLYTVRTLSEIPALDTCYRMLGLKMGVCKSRNQETGVWGAEKQIMFVGSQH